MEEESDENEEEGGTIVPKSSGIKENIQLIRER
jgi:hypothetical protein